MAELRERLEKGGLRCWEEPISAGDDRLREKLALIEQSEFFIALLVPQAFASKVAQEECTYARSKGVHIIPVIPSGVPPPLALLKVPSWITNLQPVQLPDEWEKLVRLLQRETAPKLKVPLMAPPVPEHWVEREDEQNHLADALLGRGAAGSAHPFRLVLSGAEGSGKSTLTSAVCRRPDVLEYFSGGILWADLQPPQQPETAANPISTDSIAQQAYLTASSAELEAASTSKNAILPMPVILEELKRLHFALTGERAPAEDIKIVADSVAEKIANARCLLVLSHVTDPSALPPFLAAGRSCSILLLTRLSDLILDEPVTRIELGGVTAEQGLEILAKSLPPEVGTAEAFREISQRVKQPGALRTAAEQFRKRLILENPEDALAGVLQTQTSEWIVQALTHITAPDGQANLTKLAKKAEEEHPLDSLSADLNLQLAGLRLIELTPEKKLFRLEPGVREHLRSVPATDADEEKAQPPPTPAGTLVQKARLILRGASATPQELLNLASELKRVNEFGYARKLLSLARKDSRINEDEKLRRKLIQQQALCTYKDPDKPVADRLERALEILAEGDPLAQTTTRKRSASPGPFTNASGKLTGSASTWSGLWLITCEVIVRDWRRITDIPQSTLPSFSIVSRPRKKRRPKLPTPGCRPRRCGAREARAIRQEIMRSLPELLRHSSNAWLAQLWWFHVTIAEAAFGLGDYEEASIWLKRARRVPVEDWEFESTARQLASLTRMQAGREDKLTSPAWKTIQAFLGNEAAAESKFVGKVGLALSGGGFRASLFHIGVLARLAELDLLRSVEVLSCVSGGSSIIGAHSHRNCALLRKAKRTTKSNRKITSPSCAGWKRTFSMECSAISASGSRPSGPRMRG